MTPAAPEDEDREDMARLNAGQDDALNALIGRHGEKLFHYLIRALQDQEDAADLAQETFFRVYVNRARFDPERSFSAWLHAIATNLVKDRYRRRARHPRVALDSEENETRGLLAERLADQRPTPSESLQSNERAEAVRKAVAALPEELRLPLLLAQYQDHSQAEIGAILGCSAKAVETRLYRARLQLRKMLSWLIQE